MSTPLRIAVVGAGGVGGYFGGRLAKAGIDTTFIVRGATLDAIRSRGLRVESVDGDFEVRPAATDRPEDAGVVDAVLVATKAWQVPEVAARIRPMIGPATIVVPLQNGIDAPRQLAEVLGAEHAAGGLCALVSYIVEPGVIRHAASTPTIMFGELDNRQSGRILRLRDAMREAGLEADVPPDIHKSMWSKFVFISPISGVGAMTRVPVGRWRTVPQTRQMARDAVAEAVAVAAGSGVNLAGDMIDRTMERYDALAADATASMQRDVAAGKPSELESQIGSIVRIGAEHAVPTPVHCFMYAALLPSERIARSQEE